MRTRTWLVSVTVLAGVAGVVAAGCGDDTSTNMTTTTDSGGGADVKSDTTTTPEAGGTDAKADVKAEAAPMACVDAGINVATFDSGSPVWACYQRLCGAAGDASGVGTLPACAGDCACNTAFATALACTADGGDTTTCFTPAVMSGDGGQQWYLQCVMPNMAVCNAAGMTDGGEGGTPEAGGEGGTPEGGGTDADAGTDGDAAAD